MSRMPADAKPAIDAVAPFRFAEFRSREEFDDYLRDNERLMGARWLYEQSLASQGAQVVLAGSCGLCLEDAEFTSPTEGGEATAAGRVPNWREGMTCNCDRRLINRQRALLHYLLDTRALEPWMRVFSLGDLGAMQPVLGSCAAKLTCGPDALIHAKRERDALRHPDHHLVVSAEQLNNADASKELFTVLNRILTRGGQLVFTAPFDPQGAAGQSADSLSPCDWSLLPRLLDGGFAVAKACLFWSEEFGYLGPRNFIFVAQKG
jgi:hypothetical protein